MERLTQKTGNGFAIKLNNPKNEKEARDQLMKMFAVVVNKLAAYEDTELEPDEIKKLKKENYQTPNGSEAKTKYINAEMLISELEARCMPIFEIGISGVLGDNMSIKDVIEQMPAANVQEEVRCGRWRKIQNYALCTYCQHKVNWGSKDFLSPFCPSCGAKMDGDSNG